MPVHAFWISPEIYDVHITQAALSGARAAGDITVIELAWNASSSTQAVEESSVVLCSLYPGMSDQVVLNIWLAARQEYRIKASGRTSVSLLGYYCAPDAPGSSPGSGLHIAQALTTASGAAPGPVQQHNKNKRPRLDDDGSETSRSAGASTSTAIAPANSAAGGRTSGLAKPAASLLGSTTRAVSDRASGPAGSARPNATLPNRDNVGPSSARERGDAPKRSDVGPSTSVGEQSSNSSRERSHPSQMTKGQKLNPASSATRMEPLNVTPGAGDGLAFGDVVTLSFTVTVQDTNAVVIDCRTNPMTVTMGREHVLPYIQHQMVGMKEGQHAVFVTPPRLAFGNAPRKMGGNVVPPNSTLIWDIEICAIHRTPSEDGLGGGM
ncbi:uncharacterized protein B0H18DRAFT_952532 [Fomitopsis serialis]|uniref:uncharacterized protein n=1 Tax=Fomitopsis serialis TaxID=139415 RepID=UPI0020071F1A|nr:uncharacterized protein B0H18DRAFT_952532 [Neoantrodia serialis]KAH9931858.1 hypothetical protein B0H18DRAFT_952532 [Neoantrodia serialis]